MPGGETRTTAITMEIVRESLVVDTVNRSMLDERFLADILTGGVNLLGRTILVSSGDVFSPFGFMESMREISEILSFIDANPDRLALVKSGADIANAHTSGRTGLYVYFQSPEPLANQLWRLRLFYELGLRVLQLTYNQRSLLGDGCAEGSDAGLSDLGLAMISECNRLRIALDVSHCGYKTSMEAMEASTSPVLLTHANSRALVDNPRNKTDEQVKKCVSLGGVVGVMSLPAFLRTSPDVEPTLKDMIDHIDYYMELVGPDHIGLGLDLTTGHEFDDFSLLGYRKDMYAGVWINGVQKYLPGMESLADLPAIAEALVDRGYAQSDIRKILGENFGRVLSSIWDGARA